jgi:hypothetical protein
MMKYANAFAKLLHYVVDYSMECNLQLQYISYIMAVSFIVGGNQSSGENYRQTLSHNIVPSTPLLSEVRTHNVRESRVTRLLIKVATSGT